jgi:hypothetical protein
MDFKNLESIYKYLKPADLMGTLKLQNPTNPEDIHDLFTRMILSAEGVMYTYETIKGNIDNHFNTKERSDEKKKFGKSVHVIGKEAFKLDDEKYWEAYNTGKKVGVASMKDLIPLLADTSDPATADFQATAMTVRSAYVNPSTRGVDSIDFFLNYTPPVIANLMMPYLDVEFKLTSTSRDYLNLPSPMRFLMGSTAVNNLNGYDKMLAQADYSGEVKVEQNVDGEKTTTTFPASTMGMEMFLMPQSLTNMEELGPNENRLVRAKPFLPFASLLGLDVSVQNAGAGAFAHKKATLKFKLHDKSRIGEMAEFIRGPSGFNQAVVWTTYGWVAPLNMGPNEEYSKFINNNMLMRECWSVVNSQFSFDSSGQVSFNLELVSKAAKALMDVTVSHADSNLLQFHKVIQSISAISSKILGENKFAINVTSEQILNSAASNGMISNIENVKQSVTNLISSLGNSALPRDDINKLNESLNSLVGNSKYNVANVNKMIGNSVHGEFVRLGTTPDPFLPTEEKDEYFDSDLISSIKQYNLTSKERQAAITAAKDSIPINMNGIPEVVSFGKLFLNFAVPAIMKTQSCDEVQVFFYGLNGECGPASYHSVAEFPINMTALSYAYAELLKSTNVEALSLQSFLKLIIDTNFADIRGIGFGMSSYYKPLDPNKPAEAISSETATAERGMVAWHAKYGGFKPPVIEMFVESGEENEALRSTVESLKAGATRLQQQENEKIAKSRGGSKKIIKRIHIYDKQNNPYRLAQQIIDTGKDGPLSVGEVNKGYAEGRLNKILEDATPKQLLRLKQLLESEKKSYKQALAQLKREDQSVKYGDSDINNVEVVNRPEGDEIVIPKNRQSLKAALMRSLPCLTVGTNGSMILSSNVASKTDGVMGAINIMNAGRGNNPGQAGPPSNNLGDAGGLPLRVSPVQVTMTTMGVPTASLYQTFFIDFDTGTSLDNIYNCTQLQHSISPGKFTTNWTFMYANGYGKFSNPPTVEAVVSGQMKTILNNQLQKIEDKKNEATAKAQKEANETPEVKK